MSLVVGYLRNLIIMCQLAQDQQILLMLNPILPNKYHL